MLLFIFGFGGWGRTSKYLPSKGSGLPIGLPRNWPQTLRLELRSLGFGDRYFALNYAGTVAWRRR